ncbi:MAG TPA: hypothetical protein VKC54_04540 [Patescibacteria group bacterium]|nr:hypothetical protein [Patescibacteria group bacterium]
MIISDNPPRPLEIIQPFQQTNKKDITNPDCDEILIKSKFNYLSELDCIKVGIDDHLKNIRAMNSLVTTSGTSLGSQSLSDASSFTLGINSLGDRL